MLEALADEGRRCCPLPSPGFARGSSDGNIRFFGTSRRKKLLFGICLLLSCLLLSCLLLSCLLLLLLLASASLAAASHCSASKASTLALDICFVATLVFVAAFPAAAAADARFDEGKRGIHREPPACAKPCLLARCVDKAVISILGPRTRPARGQTSLAHQMGTSTERPFGAQTCGTSSS